MLEKEFILVTSDLDFEKRAKNASRGLSEPVHFVRYSNSTEALSNCKVKTPSAVVFDEHSNGTETSLLFFQKFRAIKSCVFVPLVVVCESISSQFMALASEYLFYRVIEKKSDESNLKKTISSVLNELIKPSGLRQSLQKIALAHSKGFIGEADRILEDCYQLYRDDIDILVEYGNMCLRKGNIEKAGKVLDRISSSGSQLTDQNLRVCNFAARVRLKQGNTGAALTLLDRANILSPSNIERLILMGDAFRFQGQAENAEQKYLEVLKLDQSNVPAKKGVGLVALGQGDAEKALDFFKGTCSEEEMGGFFNNSAVMAVRRQQFNKAEKLYSAANDAVVDAKIRAKVTFNMGLMFRRWNKPEEAAESFRKALHLDPQFEKAERHLGIMRQSVEFSDGELSGEGFEDSGLSLNKGVLNSEGGADSRLDSALSLIADAGSARAIDDNHQEPLIMDFADETLQGKPPSEGRGEILRPALHSQDNGKIRTIDEPGADIKPFSVQQLLAKTGPKPQNSSKPAVMKSSQSSNSGIKEDPAADKKAFAVKLKKSSDSGKSGSNTASKRPVRQGDENPAIKVTAFIDDDDD